MALCRGILMVHLAFHIPQKYEGMLSQLRQALEEALKSQWPNTQFNVQYQDIDSITPLPCRSCVRKRRFIRAVELLQQEPTIKSLIETFDGELAEYSTQVLMLESPKFNIWLVVSI